VGVDEGVEVGVSVHEATIAVSATDVCVNSSAWDGPQESNAKLNAKTRFMNKIFFILHPILKPKATTNKKETLGVLLQSYPSHFGM